MEGLPNKMICGIDEVGRGSVAGPLISVAALFRTWETGIPGIADSKKLTPKKREKLFKLILWSPELVSVGIGQVEVSEIDKHGINAANDASFCRAVMALGIEASYFVVDGVNPISNIPRRNQLVVPKADAKYPVCGAASILAKVIRDRFMIELHEFFPAYNWKKNKGYGTQDHMNALRYQGPCRYHRQQFIRNVTPPQTGWDI